MKLKDFSAWNEYDGNVEGSGRSVKIWLINPETNEVGIFKDRKDKDTTDDISECIASDIAKVLDLPCVNYELGCYNGRRGVFGYNFIKDDEQTFIEGINYIMNVYKSYDDNKLIDIENNSVYSIEMIKEAINGVIDFSKFLEILIFDYIIGNTDRHHSNWGIIKNGDKNILAPLYDNSSSLCAYINNEKCTKLMNSLSDITMWNALVNTSSKSRIRCNKNDSKKTTHLDVIMYLRNYYYDDIIEFVNKVFLVLDKGKIHKIINNYSDLTENKKKVIELFIEKKLNKLKEIFSYRED